MYTSHLWHLPFPGQNVVIGSVRQRCSITSDLYTVCIQQCEWCEFAICVAWLQPNMTYDVSNDKPLYSHTHTLTHSQSGAKHNVYTKRATKKLTYCFIRAWWNSTSGFPHVVFPGSEPEVDRRRQLGALDHPVGPCPRRIVR